MVASVASVAVMETVKIPACVGVPEIKPVEPLSARPVGSADAVNL